MYSNIYQDLEALKEIYNSKLLTTYKNHNNDIFKMDDDDDLSHICYQNQLIQIFNINNFDEKKVCKIVEQIYDFFKHFNCIKDLIDLIKEQYISSSIALLANNDDFIFFQLLFSYDYFHEFHNYFSHILNNFNFTNNSNNNNNNSNNSNNSNNNNNFEKINERLFYNKKYNILKNIIANDYK
jgi:hypothetical protein